MADTQGKGYGPKCDVWSLGVVFFMMLAGQARLCACLCLCLHACLCVRACMRACVRVHARACPSLCV